MTRGAPRASLAKGCIGAAPDPPTYAVIASLGVARSSRAAQCSTLWSPDVFHSIRDALGTSAEAEIRKRGQVLH